MRAEFVCKNASIGTLYSQSRSFFFNLEEMPLAVRNEELRVYKRNSAKVLSFGEILYSASRLMTIKIATRVISSDTCRV